MTTKLTKHHGLGNDFLIAVNPTMTLEPTDAVHWCDRRTGIGADGLIISENLADGVWSMTLYNADGSRAEISGNGIRCLTQALGAHLGVETDTTKPFPLSIRTDGGMRSVALFGDRRRNVVHVQVDMGPVAAGPPTSKKFKTFEVDVKAQAGVNIGNPHLVVHVADPDKIDLGTVGPAIEADYPDGVNIQFSVPSSRNSIELRPWERGAGITQACGSGACVVAHQFFQWGLVDETVEVHMPGGSVEVTVGDTVALLGPSTYVGLIMVER